MKFPLTLTGFLIFAFILLNFVFSVTESPAGTTPDPKNDVFIQTRFGFLRGFRKSMTNGFIVDYFTGVPFAQKPERLKKSRLVNRWNGILNAQRYPPKCIPTIRPVNSSDFSEDCLYMNIMKPAGLNTPNPLPVVVFVHGGGFQEGDGNDASCDAFAEHFVSKQMIVVTIQYRLGMLGFLSMGCSDPLIPCNLGLWDMVTSFRFINRTILDFNGDVRNMTLMGHSAGSMAVSLHSLSPVSSKYFQKFIELSGSSWSLSRYQKDNIEQSKRILGNLNCDVTNSTSILECVKGTTLDSMYSAQINTHLWPQFGDDLLPDFPEVSVNRTKNQKLLIGVMTLESLYFTYLKSSPIIFPNIHRSTVEEYINSTIANQYGTNSLMAYDLANKYYLSSNATDSEYPYFMRQRTKIDSNTGFDIPILREVQSKFQFSPDIFLYHFSYFNPSEFDPNFPVEATYHCHEFPYIWGVFKDNYFAFDENDRKVSKFLIDSLTRFIISGDPSTLDFQWTKYDSEVSHAVIQPNPTMGKYLFQSDFAFWSSMSDRFGFDLITGLSSDSTPTTTPSSASNLSYLTSLFFIIILVA